MEEIPKKTDSEIAEVFRRIDATVEEIAKKAASYMRDMDQAYVRDEIFDAYEYAKQAHAGQFRKSGEPYILHPVEAAKELLILKPDIVTIQACFLHDVPEDTDRTVEDIELHFGEEVAFITAGMEKLSSLRYRGEERTIGSLRKMFIAMSKDLRVVFVKLADRLHNMKTIDFHPTPEKRKRIALETLNIYAPIADRLGIFDFKEALETECFRVLYPEEYAKIKQELDGLREEQRIFVERVQSTIRSTIPGNIPILDISYRIKSPFSIYKKIQRKGYDRVKDLYDLFAIRLITDTNTHCYEILGIIHSTWAPIPKRFKDYIALPKENGYQSLHTTVMWIFKEFRGQPTEIQIRTMDMHKQAEIGVAAHFEYSETGKSRIASDAYWVNELKDILSNSEDRDFMNQMKIGVFDDRIFAFTPKGDIRILPKGSTPIDFAYSVHSDIGDHVVIAKVNDKVAPLDYELRNGDRVEVIIDPNKSPSITWLSSVKTPRAKEVIKSHINRLHREELIEKGKFILNAHLEKNYGKMLDKELSMLKNLDGRILDTKAKEDVLVQLGNLSRKPGSVVRGISDSNNELFKKVQERQREIQKEKLRLQTQSSQKPQTDASLVEGAPQLIIGGEKQIPHQLAKCCNPGIKDKVVAYVTRQGVNIHKVNCNLIRKGNFERCIPAFWEGMAQTATTMEIELVFQNKLGVLKKLTEIFYQMKINIEDINTVRDNPERTKIRLTLRLDEEDYYLFDRLIERIRIGIPEYIEGKLHSLR